MATAASPAASPADIAVAFTQILRGLGLSVPTSCTHTFAEALVLVGLDDRDTTYWAGRATLVRRPEDIDLFDRAFAVFFEGRRSNGSTSPTTNRCRSRSPSTPTTTLTTTPTTPRPNDDETIELRFSAAEVLRHKDFAAYSARRTRQAQELMTDLRLVGSPRSSLRLPPTPRRTSTPDIRRTVRASIRAGGEPIDRHHLARDPRLRRLVLVLDVSGSMEPYARALLRFVHAAVAGRQKVEAFALGTRLTRLTRELTSRDPGRRGPCGGRSRCVDWSGGTRLGDGLRPFNDEWGVRGLARNSIVVILSDGWDRGDPDELAEQMQRLQRVDPPAHLGQPAEGHARLRATGAGNGGGPAVC